MSLMLGAAFLLLCACARPSVQVGSQPVLIVELEDGTRTGAIVSQDRSGYSGTGYVSGLTTDGAKVLATVQAKAGIYDVSIRYCAPSGPKGYDLHVNGGRSGGMFPQTGPQWSVHRAGKVELVEGANVVGIEKGWGYYDVDRLEFRLSPPPPPLKKPPKNLSDPKATPATRALFSRLIDLYGSKMLSGQTGIADLAAIERVAGKAPAIVGNDLMDYTPLRKRFGADPKTTTEDTIAAAQRGHIVTMHWHWGAPKDLVDKMITDDQGRTIDAKWYKGFYTNATTFDIEKTLAEPGSDGYRLLLQDIDAIAAELKKFADADIPVLWRPLHEADGKWFWWGAKGPEPYKKLWRLLRSELMGKHGLHNLIWIHNSTEPAWYPGDDEVDIVSVDAYPSDMRDPLSVAWESLIAQFDGRKLLAITEFGGVPDVDRMMRFGARWSFFVSWVGTATGADKADAVRRTYSSPYVANRPSAP